VTLPPASLIVSLTIEEHILVTSKCSRIMYNRPSSISGSSFSFGQPSSAPSPKSCELIVSTYKLSYFPVLLSSLTSRRTVQVTKLDCWFQVRFLGLHNVEFSHFIFIVDAVCSSAIELTVMSKIFTAKYCKSKS
jgi:hypothetical protein